MLACAPGSDGLGSRTRPSSGTRLSILEEDGSRRTVTFNGEIYLGAAKSSWHCPDGSTLR
jgi:hypothetical protein